MSKKSRLARERAKRRDVAWAAVSAILSLAVGLLGISVYLVAALLFICVIFVVHLIGNLECSAQLTVPLTMVIQGVVLVIAVCMGVPVIWHFRKVELSKSAEGDLRPLGYASVRFPGLKVVEWGEGGVTIGWDKRTKELMEFFPDSRLKIDTSANGDPLISTDLRDKDGKIIVKIINNHWLVNDSRNVVWDKNYTDDTLEVLDGRGHVALQLTLFKDHVRLQGIWFNDKGSGFEMAMCGKACPSHPFNLNIIPLGKGSDDGRGHENMEQLIPAEFVYPSHEHIWEWEPKQQ